MCFNRNTGCEWSIASLLIANLLRSVSSSFDRQFLDIFASIDRYRDEVENTAAAVSLLYLQDVKHITTELKDTAIIQRESGYWPMFTILLFELTNIGQQREKSLK